ncbi:MAG: hypothetical protein J0H42_23695 [Rhizobiales bacterium]|nr:hypothetical protein [Hyphomicrobiales bacterium]
MNEAKKNFRRGIIFGFGFPCKWIVATFVGLVERAPFFRTFKKVLRQMI